MKAKQTAEIGSVVHLVGNDSDMSFLLVEPSEADPFSNRVSVESPLGAAVHHKYPDDLAEVPGPLHKYIFMIERVFPSPARPHN